ncbi:MAG: PAS domain S-box protein [Nitrospira sp.]|nr:PAS domain S-box protein [Nitrospira sp.]
MVVQSFSQQSFAREYGGPVLLALGIFVLDLAVPAEVAAWLLYAIPVALTAGSSRPRTQFALMALVASLAVAGLLVSPAGFPPFSSWLNRLLGIGVMGLVATLVRGHRIKEMSPDARSRGAAPDDRVVTASEVCADKAADVGQAPAEAELHRDKLRFEGIVQSAMDAIITVDDAQKIVLFNQAAEDMFQWSAQDMLGRRLDRLIPERFRSVHGEHIRAFGRSGVTTRQMGSLGVIMGVRSSGEEFPIEAAISQIGIEGTRYYTVVLRDITERKRLEQDLAEREALLRAIIETEPECVKVLALDGTVRTMNAAGLAMVEATSPAQVVGTDVCHLVAEEFQPVFREMVHKAAHGEAGRLEFRLVGFLGTPRWLDTHVVPLRAADGSVSAVLGVTRDVTEWKKTEQLLRQSEERYRRLLAVLPDAILVNRGGGSCSLMSRDCSCSGRVGRKTCSAGRSTSWCMPTFMIWYGNGFGTYWIAAARSPKSRRRPFDWMGPSSMWRSGPPGFKTNRESAFWSCCAICRCARCRSNGCGIVRNGFRVCWGRWKM